MNRAWLCGLLLAAVPAVADIHGPDLSGMDTKVAPGDDFFAYGNGTWIRNTDIPPDRSSYGASQILTDQTTQRVGDILKNAAAHPTKSGSEAQQIGDYYASFMDEASVEAAFRQVLEVHGRLDILVSNAAVFSAERDKPVDTLDQAFWDEVLRTNLTGMYLACKPAAWSWRTFSSP